MAFNENEHPRDENGQFTTKNGGSSSSGNSSKEKFKAKLDKYGLPDRETEIKVREYLDSRGIDDATKLSNEEFNNLAKDIQDEFGVDDFEVAQELAVIDDSKFDNDFDLEFDEDDRNELYANIVDNEYVFNGKTKEQAIQAATEMFGVSPEMAKDVLDEMNFSETYFDDAFDNTAKNTWGSKKYTKDNLDEMVNDYFKIAFSDDLDDIDKSNEMLEDMEKLLPFKDEKEHQKWNDVVSSGTGEEIESFTREIASRNGKPQNVSEDKEKINYGDLTKDQINYFNENLKPFILEENENYDNELKEAKKWLEKETNDELKNYFQKQIEFYNERIKRNNEFLSNPHKAYKSGKYITPESEF